MYVYILTGPFFGKDIYEIGITENVESKIKINDVGYSKQNIILFERKIIFYSQHNFEKIIKNSLQEFHMTNNFFRLNIEKAKKIIIDLIDTYDVDIPLKNKNKKCCLFF